MIDRWIFGERGSAWDVFTVAGSLTSVLPSIGIVLDLDSGRPLPVAVRELTTLDHLAKGELVVLFDLQLEGDLSRTLEAVHLLRQMWNHEVTTVNGDHWRLDEAPNRPQPLHRGALKVMFVISEPTAEIEQQAAANGVELLGVRSSPEGQREHWIWLDDPGISELLAERERFGGGRSGS